MIAAANRKIFLEETGLLEALIQMLSSQVDFVQCFTQ